jgi:hypothetical protein
LLISQLADYLPGGIYHQLFLQAACLCQSYDLLNPQVCCQIPTIRVPSTPVPTATPADAEVQVYEDGYYQDVCFLMARQIQQECPTTQTAASTATPVLSAPITPAPVTNVMARAPLPRSNNSKSNRRMRMLAITAVVVVVCTGRFIYSCPFSSS